MLKPNKSFIFDLVVKRKQKKKKKKTFYTKYSIRRSKSKGNPEYGPYKLDIFHGPKIIKPNQDRKT